LFQSTWLIIGHECKPIYLNYFEWWTHAYHIKHKKWHYIPQLLSSKRWSIHCALFSAITLQYESIATVWKEPKVATMKILHCKRKPLCATTKSLSAKMNEGSKFKIGFQVNQGLFCHTVGCMKNFAFCTVLHFMLRWILLKLNHYYLCFVKQFATHNFFILHNAWLFSVTTIYVQVKWLHYWLFIWVISVLSGTPQISR